jgi:hypothetical protein
LTVPLLLEASAGSELEEPEPDELGSLADPLDSLEPDDSEPDELATEPLDSDVPDELLGVLDERGPTEPLAARLLAALSPGSCPEASCT